MRKRIKTPFLSPQYDAAGHRVQQGGSLARTAYPPALTAATYNANNQQTTFGANTETYDLNGNLATITDAFGTATYTWNVRNQLAGITAPGFSASFTYDAFGRRTGKTVQGVTTNYVYDGLNPVQEKNGSTVTANLLTGLDIDEFFTRTDGAGTRALLPDALGSTTALSDSAGNLQTQYTYEPFGYVSQTGQGNTNSYKFTGREDDSTGLFYYRARYYQPRLQRFVSEDPIEFEAGDLNLYAYVFNSPTNYTDPTGELIPQLVGCGIGAGISVGSDLLSGRKIDWTDAAIACGMGVLGGHWWKRGWELPLGKNVRIAPFGNRTGHQYGRWPHYHRRIPDPSKPGHGLEGQGISRHRPWETKPSDSSWLDRF